MEASAGCCWASKFDRRVGGGRQARGRRGGYGGGWAPLGHAIITVTHHSICCWLNSDFKGFQYPPNYSDGIWIKKTFLYSPWGDAFPFPITNLWLQIFFLPKLVLQITHFDRWYLRYSGALQEDRERQLPGSEQPKPSMDGYAGGFPLNCPLMPAPDHPPTTGCAGRPLPLRTSCLVLAGRSPGLEEPPLYNRFPSLSVLSLTLYLCLPHTSSLFLSGSHFLSLFFLIS